MSQGVRQDVVHPSLLDRLTDLQPQRSVDGGNERGYSMQRLKAAILRDVTWLLNTSHLAASLDLRPYPQIESSTLNYGVSALHGQSRDGVDVDLLRQSLVTALRRFEPRLLPASLKVEALEDGEAGTLQFRITADLWAEPVPLRMVMRTEIDPGLDAIHVVEARMEAA